MVCLAAGNMTYPLAFLSSSCAVTFLVCSYRFPYFDVKVTVRTRSTCPNSKARQSVFGFRPPLSGRPMVADVKVTPLFPTIALALLTNTLNRARCVLPPAKLASSATAFFHMSVISSFERLFISLRISGSACLSAKTIARISREASADTTSTRGLRLVWAHLRRAGLRWTLRRIACRRRWCLGRCGCPR